jgi:RNA polymerase sigma-70 factor (ECF subfamily)
LEELSDAALVVAIGRWRQEALAECFRRHSGAVFALSRRVLNDEALAEDVVQEVFVRLWYHPERFDSERGSLRAYLLAQTHGRSIDLLRSESSRRRREEREGKGDALIAVTETPDRAIEGLAVSEEVRKAVSSLPEKEKHVIVLAYYGGRTYREVAQDLGLPEGTVKSRIRAGLRRLRLTLAQSEVMG